MARGMTYVLIWLTLTAEVEHAIFESEWETPLTSVGTFLFNGLPVVHVYPWDLLVWATLFASYSGIKKNLVRPLLQSIRMTFGGVALLWVWGVVNGGAVYETLFQIHTFLMGMFIALLVLANCQTPAHIRALGKVVVFATVYRSCVLLVFYLVVARHLPYKLATLTDHADSVLFASGLVVLVVDTLERRTFGAIVTTVLATPLILTAIALNNRRIAWLDLALGLALTYWLLPKGVLKRRVTASMIAASPFLAAYLAIGWGHSTGIFKPVGSISSMFGSHQDTSSVMRDIENYNLMRTLKDNVLMGSGFGHMYKEEVRAYDISNIFAQYRYLPHNSLLGVIAFTGMIGFALIWQVVPVAIFLLARVCTTARQQPTLRVAAHTSIIIIATVVVQHWGDVGFFHQMVNTMLGIAIGLAGRLPVLAGLWPGVAAARAAPVPAAVATPAATQSGPAPPTAAAARR